MVLHPTQAHNPNTHRQIAARSMPSYNTEGGHAKPNKHNDPREKKAQACGQKTGNRLPKKHRNKAQG